MSTKRELMQVGLAARGYQTVECQPGWICFATGKDNPRRLGDKLTRVWFGIGSQAVRAGRAFAVAQPLPQRTRQALENEGRSLGPARPEYETSASAGELGL